MNNDPEPTEGARSFTRFLEQVADGDLHNEASEKLCALVAAMQVQARAQGKAGGEFSLKLRFKCEGNVVATAYEIGVKEPRPRRPGTVFFATRGGNLTVDNPRQRKLPLQEVKPPADEPRELPATEAREI